MFIPEIQDYDLFNQHIKNISVKIEILNENFAVVDYIIGNLISDSFSIDVESDIRRTINLVLKISKEYDILDETKKLWLNRLIRVWIGEEDLVLKVIRWYNFGTMTFDNLTYTTNTTDYSLQINCVDLVAFLNGSLKGTLTVATKIPAYEEQIKKDENGNPMTDSDGNVIKEKIPNTVFEVMKNTITQLGGIKKYNIYDSKLEIPYDLEFDAGSSIWEIITTLRDLQAGYETFFDEEGTFFFRKIPTTENDSVVLSDGMLKKITISEQITDDTTTVKNIIKVFGQTLEADSSLSLGQITTNETNKTNNTTNGIAFRNVWTFKSNDVVNLTNSIRFIVNFNIDKSVNDFYSNEDWYFQIANSNVINLNNSNQALIKTPTNFYQTVQNINPDNALTFIALNDTSFVSDWSISNEQLNIAKQTSNSNNKTYIFTNLLQSGRFFKCVNSNMNKNNTILTINIEPVSNYVCYYFDNMTEQKGFSNDINSYYTYWGLTPEEKNKTNSVTNYMTLWNAMSKKEQKKYLYRPEAFRTSLEKAHSNQTTTIENYWNLMGNGGLSNKRLNIYYSKGMPNSPAYNFVNILNKDVQNKMKQFIVTNMPEEYNAIENFTLKFNVYCRVYNTFNDVLASNTDNSHLKLVYENLRVSDPTKKTTNASDSAPYNWHFNKDSYYYYKFNSYTSTHYEAGWTSMI